MSHKITLSSRDALQQEIELLRTSCLDSEFRSTDPSALTGGDAQEGGTEDCHDFDLLLNDTPEVLLKIQSPDVNTEPLEVDLTVSGPDVDIKAMQAIQSLTASRLGQEEFQLAELKIYDLFLFLKDEILSQDLFQSDAAGEEDDKNEDEKSPSPNHINHVKLARYHLKSTTKKKNIRAWCSDMRIWALTRPGYPAFLLFEGLEEDVEEMIRLVKDQNWHALSLRAHVKYTYTRTSNESASSDSTEDLALQQCRLAQGHALNSSDRGPHQGGSKLRPGVEEIETISELVQRLKQAGIPQDEYTEALALRT
ncbi:hypothetical protein OC845_005357 [Tilletia horrida]|nr:hypothetical protein OC845_005357 [Tilletia horrida]